MSKMITMCDPPSGWKYGFPKVIPEHVLADQRKFMPWLLEEGYPEKDIGLALMHSRYWEEPEEWVGPDPDAS
jgi:hypothetical protein